MDTNSLAKITDDIAKDEQALSLQTKFKAALDSYIVGTFDNKLTQALDSLKEDIRSSIVAAYIMSDIDILEKLGVRQYFGLSSIVQLDEILMRPAHQATIDLQNFVESRQDAYNKIVALQSSLSAFKIVPNTLEENHYEIGFVLPAYYRDIGNLEKILKDIKNLLSRLAQADEEQAPLVITSISNGSVVLFIQTVHTLALHFHLFADRLIDLGEKIEAIDGLKRAYDYFTNSRKRKLNKVADEQLEADFKRIINEALRDMQLGNTNLKNEVRILLLDFIDHIKRGVNAEVKTPNLAKPEDLPESADASQQSVYNEKLAKYEQKVAMDNSNKKLFAQQQKQLFQNHSALIEDLLGKERGSTGSDTSESPNTEGSGS